MNTFAKAGRIALDTLFRKKNSLIWLRLKNRAIILTKEVLFSSISVDLEKVYEDQHIGMFGREDVYKIFVWSVELGLMEIVLVKDMNEGKLIDLICRFTQGPITHVVIGIRRFLDPETLQINEEDSAFQERVVIYSLSNIQKKLIEYRIHDQELHQFESVEEFTFKHGYFPK